MKANTTQILSRVGVLAAAGFILTLFEFPLLPSAPFLKYDASTLPVLLATFSMGPAVGVLTEALKSAIFHLSGKNTTGLVGTSAMFLAGATFAVVAGIVYSGMRNIRGAVLGLLAGTAVTTAVMFVANIYVFLPLWGIPENLRMGLAVSAVLPFNILKGLLTSFITFLLYKRVSPLLRVRKVPGA
ncbi:MAG: ECF transporter S component [Bacillota bacterium]|nr:ECF transporter S component [Bacillota bacterium]